MSKRGIPPDVLEDLDIKKKNKKKSFLINAIVEHHQARLTIPKNIVLDMNLKQGETFEVTYNKENKEIIYKLK